MAVHTFNFSVAEPPAPGNTVIDQIVSRMIAEGVQYSFDLSDPEWRFLGENTAAREAWKPTDRVPVQINDFVGRWGEPRTYAKGEDGAEAGWRAFEGNGSSNTQLLAGLGGAARCFWDTASDCMRHTSGPTGSMDFAMGLMKYSAATDEFTHWTAGADLDAEASLWPGNGAPHNFGTSCWDQAHQRMYRILRLPNQGTTWWVCYADCGKERISLTREQWLSDRGTWFGRFEESFVVTTLWPQAVFIPNLGGEWGSIFIVQSDNGNVFRFDVGTRTFTQYPNTPDMRTPVSGRDPSRLGYRGTSMVYLDGYVYAGTFNPGYFGSLDNPSPHQFWRFRPELDGTMAEPEMDLAQPPTAFDLSGYSWPGTHTEMVVIGGKIYAFHGDNWNDTNWDTPVFDGGVFCFDPATNGGKGSWSQVAPSWVERLRNAQWGDGRPVVVNRLPHNFTVTEIPRLGVALMVFQNDAYETVSWLFRPAQ